MPDLSVKEIATVNAPIHEAEGNLDQSQLCKRRIESCSDAISLLLEISK